MKHMFVVISSAGPSHDPSKSTREQPFWDEHAAFIDDLVDQGFIFMLINRADGTIVGFVVGEGVRNKLENIFNPQRSRVHGYVRADANLHVGKELIVVPDDALIEGEPAAQEDERETAPTKNDEIDLHPWEERALAEPTRPSVWTRRKDASAPVQTETPAEPLLKTETARPVENYRPAGEAKPEISPPDLESEPLTTASKDQSQA